jgi:HJR/Mrr/RecB family endonuclease
MAVVWIVIAGASLLVLWLLLNVLVRLLLESASFSGKGVTKISDILGKSHLALAHKAHESLTTVEAKLRGEDTDLKGLRNYEPKYYSPGPLEKVAYQEELPKLFARVGLGITTIVNVDDIRLLMQLSSVPAYELLRVVSEEPAPKFPYPTLPLPRPVTKPQEWTPWVCEESTYEITKPLYAGMFKPFNYFVEKSFKKVMEQATLLQFRESRAIEQATKRNEVVELLYQDAIKKYEKACQLQEKAWSEIQVKDKQRVDAFFAAYSQEKQKLESLVSLAKASSSEGLIARAEQTLKLESYPSFVPSDFLLRFDEDSRILILEHEFPDIGSINWVKSVKLKSGHTVKPANQKELKDSSNLLYPTLSLRFASELVRLDLDNIVEAIVVNGWSNYVEKSTGQLKRAYCSSLFATKTQLLSINLAAADPLAAFSALKGVAARSLELTPIAPILRLNTEDKRFVDAKDVLANMAQGENIAAMDWEDFEHLCRELFEKAFAGSGAEVKVTQASRDQGVDAVIFDPDVLRGGKIVVQAKRYTNTVDVSAVRDLYGAIINEGATKGILVTTSHYGPDAYGFAKDKPITLLNGEELLGLLKKYGYSFRINLAEAKRLNAESKSLHDSKFFS